MARNKRVTTVNPSQMHGEAKNEAYGKEQKGVIKCPNCINVHFKKRWYTSREDLIKRLDVLRLEVTGSKLCPACQMIKDHAFEGEIFIDNVPAEEKQELIRLIENYSERATGIDPQDRIIEIKKVGSRYRVTTTENQMARQLAKKIKDVFNKVKVEFSKSREPFEVSRIVVTFLEKS